MDTAQWPQGIGDAKAAEKKPRPHQKEHALNCPRCSSTNTKFCYYNNYSLSQPRYFCKTCRRYWTQGGSLRNVPVGGGSRKNKRSSSSSSSSLSSLPSAMKGPSLGPEKFCDQNPRMIHEGQDLNLAYNPALYNMGISEFVNFDPQNPSYAAAAGAAGHQFPVMELSKAGNFVGPNPIYDSAGGFPGLKQSLGFSGEGLEINGFGYLQGVDEDHHANSSSSRNLFFPFGNHLKQTVANGDQQFEHGKGEANGFWSGMLAGGSSR